MLHEQLWRALQRARVGALAAHLRFVKRWDTEEEQMWWE